MKNKSIRYYDVRCRLLLCVTRQINQRKRDEGGGDERLFARRVYVCGGRKEQNEIEIKYIEGRVH
jgi:hypothetical protein